MYKMKAAADLERNARSAPAVDQAPSGLPNQTDNWLKLDDVCYSNPELLERKRWFTRRLR